MDENGIPVYSIRKKDFKKRISSIVDLNKIKPECNEIETEILTTTYDTENLNSAIISQFDSFFKSEELEPKSDQTVSHTEDLQKQAKSSAPFYIEENFDFSDDNTEKIYKDRLDIVSKYYKKPQVDDTLTIDDLNIPSNIWLCLFDYQKTCLKWLWELHRKQIGGILSDEMGLGKTIQIIAYLASINVTHYINTPELKFKPILIIGTVTILKLWMREIFNWWPYFRVVILHKSSKNIGSIPKFLKKHSNIDDLIILTSYGTFIKYSKNFISVDYYYVILDEGHKIKNPNSIINQSVIQLASPHRIIISGTPIQNNLKELWSLFNFVYPGLLGSLDMFMKDIAFHITHANYSNATPLQIKTGFRCAKMLKSVIEPYLLRRTKKQVHLDIKLPLKRDFIMYCKLTEAQSKIYKFFVNNEEFQSIYNGNYSQVFKGISILQKICNHPSLVDDIIHKESNKSWHKSAKLLVVDSLLSKWLSESHRVLLYAQRRKMLDIIEIYVKEKGFSFLRMDGTVLSTKRQSLIDSFNNDSSIFLFLLTTKVGGIGISLIGADRVILFDPDWNPSTDSQAKERACRIGQTKNVVTYRLLTAGTIEEKMYNRQIFKQFISNKILENPGQMRSSITFGDIHELFSFDDKNNNKLECNSLVPEQCKLSVSSSNKRKKYKWRHEDDISSDDNISSFFIDRSKIIKKIRQTDADQSSITDHMLIEKEADRIAQKALSSLNNSFNNFKNPLSKYISKTGNASQIINSLKTYDKIDSTIDSQVDLEEEITQFLKINKGQATSKAIISHIQNKLYIKSSIEDIKQILRRIARLKSSPTLQSKIWVLRKNIKFNKG